MKLWQRVIKIRIRRCIIISKNQFRFMLGRFPIELNHILRQMIEYFKARKRFAHGFYRVGKSMLQGT